jgi:hypothetical protein
MKKTNKIRLFTVSICLVLAAPLIVNLLIPAPVSKTETASVETGNSGAEINFKIKEGFFGEFCAVGKPCIELPYKENTITNVGFNHLELLMGVGANSPVKALALGNGTAPAIGDTSLNSEQTICGLTRVNGTYYDLGTGLWEINTTFTYTCSSALKVNTTANFNWTTTGAMYSGGTISDVNFATNGDQLKLRHNFSITEG